MAARTEKGKKKGSGGRILRERHWEMRQLPGKEWKKQPVTSEGELSWQQKAPVGQSSEGFQNATS